MQSSVIRIGRLALVLAGLPLLAANLQGADSDPAVQSAPADASAAQPASAAPPDAQLSGGASQIVKLAQSGVGEDVLLAYVGTVNSKFNLGTDQILYLNDIGVSGPVVKAMILRDAALEAASQAAVNSLVQPMVPPPPVNPADGGNVPPSPPMDNPDTGNPPGNPGDYATDDSGYFYNSLAPYGSWVYVPGCGLCWQPTVCLMNREWRPYGDRGRWLYSDCGWYWQSDYSWGWAAFHYGRWFNDAGRGWVWSPGRVWGPAWVSWRQSGEYCGWAPLPPAARFVPGTGFVYSGQVTGAGFDFGLRANQYTFIPLERLTDYAPARYSVPTWQAGEVFMQTAVINHYTVQNNHVVNQGVDPRLVASLSRTEVRRAEIRELPGNGGQSVQPDRLARHGGALVIYRPQLPAPSVQRMGAPAGQGISRPVSAPARSGFAPRTAAPAPNPAPSPAHEVYPPGSLVIIGDRNQSAAHAGAAAPLPNMNLSYLANKNGNGYEPAAEQATYHPVNYPAPAPSAGFNFEPIYSRPNVVARATPPSPPAQSQTTIIMPGRFSVAQHQSANLQPGASTRPAFTVAERIHSEPGAEAGHHEGQSLAHTESHDESRSESHPESQPAHTESSPAAHAASVAAAAPGASGFSSGHR